MSEDVYFNEPGFEGEAGTDEGAKKNEAYSNIVKYCNIKYAMIDQIKNPPEGFEDVIKRHFFLKKAEILAECNKWLSTAESKPASYIGLVSDHNSTWCTQFKSKYHQMLQEAITELEEVLNNIPAPKASDAKLRLRSGMKKKNNNNGSNRLAAKKKEETFDMNVGVAKFEDIDVNYDEEVKDDDETASTQQSGDAIDINDDKVKDRWSRYIGAMGIDAVAKQSKCSLFLAGLGPLGVEIAKNIVMSGIKRLTLHDSKAASYNDLAG